MNDRTNILARIREGLSAAAPKPGGHREPAKGTPPPQVERIRAALPAVGKDLQENLALFGKNAVELHANFKVVKDIDAAVAILKELAQSEKWANVASHKGQLTDAICQGLGLPVFKTDAPFDKHELEKCPVGITECDALVAHTGSVAVTTQSAGGRALSILPPHHVVLARQDQLVPGLPDAFALLRARYGAAFPSMISFITGPSRTGDIERILVLGAHGPKKLTILCLQNGF